MAPPFQLQDVIFIDTGKPLGSGLHDGS
jgi:hypothetical protein